ncbi:MAG: NUDIX hydrolase [Gammaproteobacteria bacterium]|jgi:8-oxo-dGTP pyrophosphatase MutT (NUDIX family)
MDRFARKELKHAPGPRPDGSLLAETPWRRDTRRERFANPFFTIFEDQAWNGRAGQHFDYGIISFRNRAVGILPLEPDGRVWLVGQHRYAIDQFTWELPMGGVPLEANLLEGAQRELQEETGLSAMHWEPLLPEVHLSNSVTDEVGTVFLARELTAGPMAPEASEELWVITVPWREAVHAALDGRITDSLTVAGLLALAARATDFGLAHPGGGFRP